MITSIQDFFFLIYSFTVTKRNKSDKTPAGTKDLHHYYWIIKIGYLLIKSLNEIN